MESVKTDESPAKMNDGIPNASKNDSVQNFQKCIYDIIENNGVLNDLRAYLRSHIVDVIKNAQTGNPPACQKHFTQRLELTYQALNMLIVEYLLCLEFSYSLSVFVSEIPLANMVFEFAQTLFQSSDSGIMKLKFSDSDVWSILNYLGVKCDSEHASNIVDTYRKDDNSPLLLCLLKCMPLYHKVTVTSEQGPKFRHSSSESLPSTPNSSDTVDKTRCTKTNGACPDKCKHYMFCKTCQATVRKVKDKYKRKKEVLAKNIKDTSTNPIIGEILMKNISAMEKALIDEMFQQLKTVYEAEIEMVRGEEQKKIKGSLASHAVLLQKHQDELDEAFKVREEELERNVQQKKKFLWGLAKALREQHTQMSRAMNQVKNETERLSIKEESLKTQLFEAESILRERGEEIRSQISNELTILEARLESMRKERDTIHKERRDLENYKSEYDSKLSINDNIQSNYSLVKNELGILKKYLESINMQPKCVIERSTLTEMCDVTSKINIILNNEQDTDRNTLKSDSDDRVSRAPNQVLNNLKKQNNYSNPPLDVIYQERVSSNTRCRSPTSEAGDVRDSQRMDSTVRRLREENDRLKTFSRQQRQHIDDLSRQQARLQSELTAAFLHNELTHIRPRTAPSVLPQSNLFTQSLGASAIANCFGWRKGAGEELSAFSNAEPRILVPDDVVPFVGVVRDRQTDYRRHMISRWRSLRHRVTPFAGSRARPLRVAAGHARDQRPGANDAHVDAELTFSVPEPAHVLEAEFNRVASENNGNIEHPAASVEVRTSREKSSKSVRREAKQKLRNKDTVVRNDPHAAGREKSPNTVLREAKLRLRKLEIEAEAVEKSYLNFKMRQTERKEQNNACDDIISLDVEKFDAKRTKSLQKLDENHYLRTNVHSNYTKINELHSIKNDIKKYINCETKFNINKMPAAKIILEKAPDTFKQDEGNKVNNNYLETPLIEFRKLYHSQKSSISFKKVDRTSYPNTENVEIPKNRGNNTDNEEKSPENLYPEKDDASNPKKSSVMNDQELSRTVNGKNDTQSAQKIPTTIYPKVESERNSENPNNELDIQIKNRQAELEILNDNLSQIYNLQGINKVEQNPATEYVYISVDNKLEDRTDDNNLKIEVESVSESNNLKITESQPQIEVVVHSSVETRVTSVSVVEEKERISTHTTIIVSPKSLSPRGENAQSPKKSLSPFSIELAPEIHLSKPLISSSDMQLEVSKEGIEDSINEYDKGEDDFSVDVDNYNSRSDYENNSPISLPKSSEDDNFWDS